MRYTYFRVTHSNKSIHLFKTDGIVDNKDDGFAGMKKRNDNENCWRVQTFKELSSSILNQAIKYCLEDGGICTIEELIAATPKENL